MSQTEDTIIEEILKYVAQKGGPLSQWYVGISKDPQKSLFKEHNVPKDKTPWFYRFAFDHIEAERIEDALLRRGFDGASMNKDINAKGIYVYKKNSQTKE
ncbi:MAG: hypothetical protein KA120_04415 [Candidatus Goldbacteria bacterium]|nr:hypothetical protein [Candidatus Goldiibacteriota bacterium]HPD18642.1 hypothetical protein [Candidatus Goldiibacteriota bacterium]